MFAMKKIFMHLPDDTAVGYYRAILPTRFCQKPLREEGVELSIGKEFRPKEEYSAVIFHRILSPKILPTILALKRRGVTVAIELDDLMSHIPTHSPAAITDDDRELYYAGLDLADYLIVSTEALGKALVVPHGKALLAPNLIDPAPYRRTAPRQQNSPLRILFAGSETHQDDLSLLIEPIGKVLEKHRDRVIFYFMGCCHPEILTRYYGVGVDVLAPVTLAAYGPSLVNISPDIALCPLLDTEFNACKSAIKYFEMTLAGAAVIASPVGPYVRTKTAPASNAAEWVEWMEAFIEREESRESFATIAANQIMQLHSWTNQRCFEPWLNAFRNLVRMGRFA